MSSAAVVIGALKVKSHSPDLLLRVPMHWCCCGLLLFAQGLALLSPILPPAFPPFFCFGYKTTENKYGSVNVLHVFSDIWM